MKLRKTPDFIQIAVVLILLTAGLLAINSATSSESGEFSNVFKKQVIWVILGIFAFIGAFFLSQKFYFAVSYILYTIAVAFLVVLLLVQPGTGPARWFNLGSFNFQPSELAKMALILCLSRFLTDKKRISNKFSVTFRCLLLIGIPTGLVLLEPDLGTAVVYSLIGLPILIMGRVNINHLILLMMPVIVLISSFNIIIMILVIAGFAILFINLKINYIHLLLILIVNIGIGFSGPKMWNNLHPYQQRRILAFLNPEADPRGAGYQIIQSKVAVGSGGAWGKGYMQGTQSQLKFLPEGHTDFIFSVFSEEMGFAGSIMILLMFLLISYRGIIAAARHRNYFASMVIIGVSAHFFMHACVNIGMTVGLLPVTGLPLPFMSYGGSSLLTNMALAGMMIGMGMNWREY